jgi:uncharacterized protein (DUF2236 family)
VEGPLSAALVPVARSVGPCDARPVTSASVLTPALPDLGLFGPQSVTWRVHGDPSMLVAGFRALLLQATHPLVMAGFHDNSGFRDDPWGRLQRTADWVATVTYGTTEEVERAGRGLRRLHAGLAPGVEPESGLAYRVDDPELLLWVHVTEVESFLSTYRRCGGRLSDAEAEEYLRESRRSAALVGVDPAAVPSTPAEVDAYYARVRPQLRVTEVARRNAEWAFTPPMPAWVEWATPARPVWASVIALSTAMLPPWARRLYRMPGLPVTDAAATLAGRALRRALLTVPERLRESPPRRVARERVAAARSGTGRSPSGSTSTAG